MEKLFYDICLFISKDGGVNFGITRLQTDDTHNIKTETFINKKKAEIIEAKFQAILQTILGTDISKNFNSCHMIIEDKVIIVEYKDQVDKLFIVDIEDDTKKE